MSFYTVSNDITQLIINYLLMGDASKFSITNKENDQSIKKYYISNLKPINCSLKDWNITFPNAKYAKLQKNISIDNDEFEYLTKVEVLDMSMCLTTLIDHSFHNLLHIRELNFQGYRGHIIRDSIFDYLTNLEKFYIDNNYTITDEGIKKLSKIKDLSIHNCLNITNDGLSNLITVEKLSIYNLQKLTDDVFKNLTNIQELEITFGDITDIGISYLINIKKLNFISCRKIKCKKFDKLIKLNNLSIDGYQFLDEDLISLANIKSICIYRCQINGSGLQYLTNCNIISIYECPIIDKELDILYKLDNFNQINIYRCKFLTKNKKNELKSILGNKFNTDK